MTYLKATFQIAANSLMFLNLQYFFYSVSCLRVPQGWSLEQILFVILVNDLVNALKTSPQLFTYDTCNLIGSTSFDSLVRFCNSELFHVYEWITSNCLALNSYKTQALLISRRKIDPKFTNMAINNHTCQHLKMPNREISY